MPIPMLVIYEPDERGWRKVGFGGQILGTAYRFSDIAELLRQAGMENAEDFDLTQGEFVQWRGGGPETWEESTP
ncbi:hypothetical protein ACIPW5_36625 [Streptomyces sp. NPDC090077]|uniref:hypothetical protein n=1 Tax=Streptomyces sp. NPDC090077 TaxID=3365938 RepID=UPI00380B263A